MKTPTEKYLEKLDDKVKNKEKLSLWDVQVLGLLESERNGYASKSWVNSKISEIVAKRNNYIMSKRNKS